MKVHTIKIANVFSRVPAGRVPADGNYNGQKFRKEFLVKNLRINDKLIIDFDGLEGSGSSFLEEAFGGLINYEKFTLLELRNKLDFISEEDKSIILEIWTYLENAEKNANK